MFTLEQIIEAGKKALGLAATPTTPAPAAPADPFASIAQLAEEGPAFELTALGALQLEDRQYRVHFRSGTSGEYDGYTLRTSAPFPLSEVVSIEPVVGQAAPKAPQHALAASAPGAPPAGDFYFVK